MQKLTLFINRNQTLLINSFLLLFSLFLILFSSDFPFYWDNIVQLSIPAHWYFENDFKFFYLPDEIATGHPTFTGMYFALLWKIFNRSLLVSHLGMLPFVFGLLYQLHKLLINLKFKKTLFIFLILIGVIIDPTFISQLSLITFDIIQLFFLFCCINLILTQKDYLFSITYIFLVLISLRGSLMGFALIIFQFLYNTFYLNKNKFNFTSFLKYIPGCLALILFLVSFKIEKGWVIHNTVSNKWAESSKFVDFLFLLKNIVIFIWEIIDFGRIGLCLIMFYILIKAIKKRKIEDSKLKILLLIILSQFLVFFPITVIYRNPFGHRYFLPIIITLIIASLHWILNDSKKPITLYSITILLLFSGHFWLYPLKKSQGWDSCTLHWKYMNVSKKMDSYISNKNISRTTISTFFPNYYSNYLKYLSPEKNESEYYFSENPLQAPYIIYSNAFNVNDDIIDNLFTKKGDNWKLLKEFRDGRIFISLYKKTNYLEAELSRY